MAGGVLETFVRILSFTLTFAIFGRVIMSWISPTGNDPISPILYQITEPILAPIRRVLPKLGVFDFSPIVALFLLQIVSSQLTRLL